MSENELPTTPLPPPPPEPAPEPIPPPPAESAPDGPVLSETPRWVPAAVVAGMVLCIEGLIVHNIRPEAAAGAPNLVADAAVVAGWIGVLSLIGGYFAYLLSKVALPDALVAAVLTAVAGVSYGAGWWILLTALNGDAATIVGIRNAGWTGIPAAVASAVGILACAGLFSVAFLWGTRTVWPYFRAAVALNVMAMLHLVVILLGLASFLNARYVPTYEWATVDLTSTGQYSLSDKTRAILDKVEGEILVFAVDYGAARREGSGNFGGIQGLLRQYQAACPRMTFRPLDALRGQDEMRKAFSEAGMESLIDGLTGAEDVVVFGFRPSGEKLVVRTRVVAVNQEFSDTSALGALRFKGEGILTNAVNEVVFARRRVAFIEGHGEKQGGNAAAPAKSVAAFAEALRGDNFAVTTIHLAKEPTIPPDVDLVVIPGPAAPFSGAEADAIGGYLDRGGAVLLFLDPLISGEATTGLEGILSGFGISAPRDMVVLSWLVEQTLRGDVPNQTTEVYAAKDEFGRHPAMRALASSEFTVSFKVALPVLRTEKPPEGVEIQDLLYAPREIRGFRPFGAKIRPGRFQKGEVRPEPGDLVDKRMPLGVTAERKSVAGGKAGGRLLVFGDSDFASDLCLDPRSPAVVHGHRSLLLNTISWAVRRDLVAIDPKSVESEVVQLRTLDRDLAFWAMAVALPVLVLGIAVGMWWIRRR